MKKSLFYLFLSLGVCVSCSSNFSLNNLTSKNSYNDSSLNNEDFKVTWKNENGDILGSESYKKGDMPSYKGSTPTIPSEGPVTYTFNGWSPTICPVEGNQVYTATYVSSQKTYNVVWLNWNEEELERDANVNYGEFPHYDGATPTKPSSATNSYEFIGWDKELEVVTQPTKYIAQYKEVPLHKYDVSINCEGCTFSGRSGYCEKVAGGTDLEFNFDLDSDISTTYPTIIFKLNGEISDDYEYDETKGKLKFKVEGNTEIDAISKKCLAIGLEVAHPECNVSFNIEGDLSFVDWGDGTIDKNTSHVYLSSSQPNLIKIVGDINKVNSINGEYIENIVIPNNIDSVSANAFAPCVNLKSLTLPSLFGNRLYEYFGNEIDDVPNSLVSVILTDCSSIISKAFYRCRSLTSIAIFGDLTSIGEEVFYYCDSLTSITIPDSVISIGNYAFQYCSSLTSITIPNGVTSIGDYAFNNCSSLTSFTIPDSVTSIGQWAFHNCSSLTSITIPYGVTFIGVRAFSECSSLTSMTIPDSVTSLGEAAFKACTNLTSLSLPSLFGKELYKYFGDTSSSVISSLKSITLTNCTSIGEKAFYSCSSLTSIMIPDTVTSIGDSAFNSCSSLSSFEIPNSVTSIGKNAFLGCTSLTSITIPSSVTALGSSVFKNWSSQQTIYCEAESKPSGWDDSWDSLCQAQIVWGCKPS